jgi:hypothetical protein
VNGAATLVLQAGQSAQVLREASAWRAAVMMGPTITGNLSVSGEVQSTGPIRMQAGTALLPAITPTGDPDTGFHAPAANILAVSLGGVEVARWEGSRYQINGANGPTLLRVAGASFALRAQSAAGVGMVVEATNNTEGSYQPMLLGGSTVTLTTSGTTRVTVPASGAISVVDGLDVAGNLRFDSGYGSVAQAFGCRAWVNFNGTGTVAIRASGNVTSITDNGVGDYTVNFTTAMPDANYALVGSAGGDASRWSFAIGISHQTAPTTSAVRISVSVGSAGGFDAQQVSVGIFR